MSTADWICDCGDNADRYCGGCGLHMCKICNRKHLHECELCKRLVCEECIQEASCEDCMSTNPVKK